MKSFAPERIPTCANCVTLVERKGKKGKEKEKERERIATSDRGNW